MAQTQTTTPSLTRYLNSGNALTPILVAGRAGQTAGVRRLYGLPPPARLLYNSGVNPISPTPNPAFESYYTDLAAYAAQNAAQEQTTRLAFTKLLDHYGKAAGWTLLLERTLEAGRKRPDGTLQDNFRIPRGYWEAKDTGDDLDAEIAAKLKLGYPQTNIIFEDTRRAVLYQNKQRVLDADIRQPEQLAALLTRFFSHTEEQIDEFHKAVAVFDERIPDLAQALKGIIETALTDNPKFAEAFDTFHTLCKGALNPAIRRDAIEEMLVQHLLTERLFRTVLENSEFIKRNVIAQEIERVIDALTSQSFSRSEFLKALDYFYLAIENEAKTITTYAEKQGFLNTVYERFFQGFSKDQADTHGIVYTPQALVDFMCASVEHVLSSAFGLSLASPGVVVLDPCTGTGNFLVNLLRRIPPLDLPQKYAQDLFANEVMLLPYYIASLNIEHAYYEVAKTYQSFPGLCFADTLDLAEAQQLAMFSAENTERVQREKDAPVTVIVGNPPYNVGQKNENDNNKNRTYAEVDNRIKQTYVKDSKATLRTQLYDAYCRFFRWATDRLGDRDGVVCFVTNNSFLEGFAFEGMRKHLAQDFTQIYHLDLGGNARKRGGGSVFGIRVGVGITVLVRKREGATTSHKPATIYHHALEDKQSGAMKLAEMDTLGDISGVEWQELTPDAKHNWITEDLHTHYADFLPIATKEAKASKSIDVHAVFKTYSPGVKTDRDSVVYDFDKQKLAARVEQFIEDYNAEVLRWAKSGRPKDVDNFVSYEKVKWSEHLKGEMKRERYAEFDEARIRTALYRPYCKQLLYYDDILNDRPGAFHEYFPRSSGENRVIWLKVGLEVPMYALMTDIAPDFMTQGGTQCFPLYTYALDGKLRRDNITDWALAQFRDAYGPDVSKRDIWHYVYALLHHPDYRERYKENLKRELPRVPLVGRGEVGPLTPNNGGTGEEGTLASNNEGTGGEAEPSLAPRYRGGGASDSPRIGGRGAIFRAFADAGAQLAALHVGYEDAAEYPLEQEVSKDDSPHWRVSKMRLSPDKTAVRVNEYLTLTGIPPEAFLYRLGNRSALEWVIDQYQATTDARSGTGSDPNRADDPLYIARLVRRVVTVSMETTKIVQSLPPLAATGF